MEARSATSGRVEVRVRVRNEPYAQRAAEAAIALACRCLPDRLRQDRVDEWIAEVSAILGDPEVRPAWRRSWSACWFVFGVTRAVRGERGVERFDPEELKARVPESVIRWGVAVIIPTCLSVTPSGRIGAPPSRLERVGLALVRSRLRLAPRWQSARGLGWRRAHRTDPLVFLVISRDRSCVERHWMASGSEGSLSWPL